MPIQLGNKTFIKEEDIEKCGLDAIEAIKNGLPEEAQCVSVIRYILEEAQDMVTHMPIAFSRKCRKEGGQDRNFERI